MSSVQQQLEDYRRRRRRQEKLADLKYKIWSRFSSMFGLWKSDVKDEGGGGGGLCPNDENLRRKNTTTTPTDEDDLPPPPPPVTYTRLDWAMLFLKVVIWILLQKVFILLEFGAVFFIFSAFFFIWYNLRNEPKRKGEASAYSVFNPNCEMIDGTFTAEQFERELLHRM